MSTDELNEYMAIPDNKGLDFKVTMAIDSDDHACEALLVEMEMPRD